MHLAEKLESWGVIGAIHPGKLVHVKDDISGASFLVDTGSSYSILPYSSSLQPTGPLLKSAGGQRIPCWGRHCLSISFNGRHYSWNFLLAVVEFRILGVDFLQKFQLLVDTAACCLLGSPSPSSSAAPQAALALGPATAASVNTPTAGAAPQLADSEQLLLAEFSYVLNAEGCLPPSMRWSIISSPLATQSLQNFGVWTLPSSQRPKRNFHG